MNRFKLVLIFAAAILLPVPARGDADTRYLIEFLAGEGFSFNEYRYRDLSLEAREFPEFTHELGLNAYLYMVFGWFGLGAGAGIQYNLNGASSEYQDDPTIKYIFYWIKIPLFLSLSLNRGTAMAHLDGGVYASFFLAGRREWEDEGHGENRSGSLSGSDVSPDFGARFQFCMDMETAAPGKGKSASALGLGLGIFLEKAWSIS